jgi:hypothetical protein
MSIAFRCTLPRLYGNEALIQAMGGCMSNKKRRSREYDCQSDGERCRIDLHFEYVLSFLEALKKR